MSIQLVIKSDMFQDNVKSILYHDFDYGLIRLHDLDNWLMRGVPGQKRMLTPPMHMIPPVVYPGVCICHALTFAFFFITKVITVVIFALS